MKLISILSISSTIIMAALIASCMRHPKIMPAVATPQQLGTFGGEIQLPTDLKCVRLVFKVDRDRLYYSMTCVSVERKEYRLFTGQVGLEAR